MAEQNNEIELIDILNILWKRKWFIISSTLILIILAGILSFLLPKKWEISAVFIPSKIFVLTAEGKYEEAVVTDPKQIAGQINEGSYDIFISEELNIERQSFPKLKAFNLPETNLIRVSIRDKNIEKSISILNTLFSRLKENLDEKTKIEIKGIESQIKSEEIEKFRVEKEIQMLQNTLTITQKRQKEIEAEMSETRERIRLLEDDQRALLKKQNRSEAEGFAMFLYSNEIQLSLRYINTLNELINSKKVEMESLKQSIDNNTQNIRQRENTIEMLKERKGGIDYTELVKKPTSSLNPVFPQKKLFVLVAFLFGVIFFSLLAFFLEYLEKQKLQG